MSAYGPSKAFFLVAGQDLSGDVFNLEVEVEGLLEETHGLSDSWEETKPVGIAKVMLKADGGLYDDRAAGINAAFQGISTNQLSLIGLADKTTGALCMTLDGLIASKWKRIASRTELTKANAEFTVTGVLYNGQLINATTVSAAASGDTKASKLDHSTVASQLNPTTYAITNITAAASAVITSVAHGLTTGEIVNISGSDSTPVADGLRTVTVTGVDTFTIVLTTTIAGTTGTYKKVNSAQAIIDLHVTNLTLGGYTDLIVTPVTSADAVTWVTLGAAFTAVTAVPANQRVTTANTAGLVRRYTACTWAFTGSGSGNSALFYVAIWRSLT